MRLVVAIVKPATVECVRQALAAVHVTRLTICDAHEYDLGSPGALAQETILEIAVNEDFLERTVTTLAEVIAALGPESGRFFVLPIDQAVQIYRDVRGPEAV
jgi:nitrogen regulatory protein PII